MNLFGNASLRSPRIRCWQWRSRRRKNLARHFSTCFIVSLLFWRPPDGFVVPAVSIRSSSSSSSSSISAIQTVESRAAAEVRNPSAVTTHDSENKSLNRLTCRLQGGLVEKNTKRICAQLGLSWQGKKTSERAIELRLRQMNFASDLVFVPTASDMELSTKMFDQKMLLLDLPNLLRKEVILTYSISQLCSELAKLELRLI